MLDYEQYKLGCEDDMMFFESVMKDCEDDVMCDEDLDFFAEELELSMQERDVAGYDIEAIDGFKNEQHDEHRECVRCFSIISEDLLQRIFSFCYSRAVNRKWLHCSNTVQRDRWMITFNAALNFSEDLVQAIEDALFEYCSGRVSREYKTVARRLIFNLKQTDAGNNNALRERVLLGDLPPSHLVRMDATQLAPQQLKEQRKEWCRKRTLEVTRSSLSGMESLETDFFQCDHCGGVKCKYMRSRRRNQCDRIRMMVSCLSCLHSWEH